MVNKSVRYTKAPFRYIIKGTISCTKLSCSNPCIDNRLDGWREEGSPTLH